MRTGQGRCFPSLNFTILTTAGIESWLNLLTLHLILWRSCLLIKAQCTLPVKSHSYYKVFEATVSHCGINNLYLY